MNTAQKPDSAPITPEAVEQLIQVLINTKTSELSVQQQALLSKVLFPDTHTSQVNVCGKVRDLRPLTIKYARRICEDLKVIQTKVMESVQTNLPVQLTSDMLAGFLRVATVLCEFYGWDDVLAKIQEEDIENSELMALAMTQQLVQGTNDFLLLPLRLLLKMAQLHEILAIQLTDDSRGSNTSTTQDS